MATDSAILAEGYSDWLKQLNTYIAHAQQPAALVVNAGSIPLCARTGRNIVRRQVAAVSNFAARLSRPGSELDTRNELDE